MNNYKAKNGKRIDKNPFSLLDYENLVNNDGKIEEFCRCSVKGKVLKKLSLKDFIDDGIEFLKTETKDGDLNQSQNYAKIGSSGDSAKIGSSGDSAKIGSSGDSAKIGSSGYYAKIGSSGYYAKIGSSGDSAKIGSSGYYAKIGSSGYYAKIGSSGDSAKIGIEGKNSIGFACGRNSIIKGVKGTWFSLAEYKYNPKRGVNIPIFAKSAQIGNKDYKDCFGKVLKAGQYYQLINKEFTPIDIVDGDRMVILNEKSLGDFTIYKTLYIEDFKEGKKEIQFVAKRGDFTAHGKSIKEAISDVEFKFLQSQDVQVHIKRVKEQGYITPNDYRLLTGACRYGTNRWLEQNGFTWQDKKSIEEAIELTKGQYGHDRLVELMK